MPSKKSIDSGILLQTSILILSFSLAIFGLSEALGLIDVQLSMIFFIIVLPFLITTLCISLANIRESERLFSLSNYFFFGSLLLMTVSFVLMFSISLLPPIELPDLNFLLPLVLIVVFFLLGILNIMGEKFYIDFKNSIRKGLYLLLKRIEESKEMPHRLLIIFDDIVFADMLSPFDKKKIPLFSEWSRTIHHHNKINDLYLKNEKLILISQNPDVEPIIKIAKERKNKILGLLIADIPEIERKRLEEKYNIPVEIFITDKHSKRRDS
ncbi:MAG: hypothetical protein ABIJ92_03070 [Candidatus Aenigmatarchaeota archaeon]